ncbi:MAG: PAS domain S-box protein [Rhodocyclaceae bacterium]|nr:PAS domain S-box protein [Rhodocyclaceae bacterium]
MGTTETREEKLAPARRPAVPADVWRHVFDAIEDPVFLHDAQFRVLLANAAYCREAGMSEAEAQGKLYWEVFPRGAGPLPRRKEAAGGNRHDASQDEVQVGAKLFLAKGYTVRDGQGAPLHSLFILSDITAQRLAEMALAESEERVRRAAETARDAIVSLDGESGAITAWNPAATMMFGYTREEVLGRNVHDFLLPPRFRAAANAGMAHFASHGEGPVVGKTQELIAMHRDGTEFPVELSISAVQIHGKWHATGIARDISERKCAEEALKNLATKFRTVYEASSDAIILVDAAGFCDCNKAAVQMFGHASRDDFLGGVLSQLFPPTQPGGRDSMSLANEHMAAAFERGSDRFEWLHRRQDGTEFPAEVLLTAMTLDGKPALQATVRDITERQRAAEKDRRLSQLYRTISRCNEALVRALDEGALTHDMCRVLTEEGGFPMVWVGYAEHGGAKLIRPVASAGLAEQFLEAINPTWADENGGQGPAGAAIRGGAAVVCLDIRTDERCEAVRELALQRGYLAVAAFPLKFNEHGLGVLVVYGRQADEFTADIISLLGELAGDLAFGIGNLRARADRLHILEKLEASLDHAVTAIAAMVEMRDPYTAGHQRRVARLAMAIAAEMGLSADRLEGLHMACVLHDIGKIHVPAEILSNPGKLSAAEFEIIKTHAQVGWEVLKGIDFPWPVADVVYQHHEKLDGSGYPRGLKGDEILPDARILAVADVVESMTSHRPYRPGFGIFPALQEISQRKGSVYDAAAVEACLRLFMEKNYQW